jgi:hypothetical protein
VDFQVHDSQLPVNHEDISLLPQQGIDKGCSSQTPTLSLFLTVPLTSTDKDLKFSFTYRILYPSGEINWLGSFGQNGCILVDSSRTTPHLLLAEGWHHDTDEGPQVWDARGQHVDNVKIGRIAHPTDWKIWGLGRDR